MHTYYSMYQPHEEIRMRIRRPGSADHRPLLLFLHSAERRLGHALSCWPLRDAYLDAW